MDNFNYQMQMQNLLRQHSEAKSKVTKGIVLTAIGGFLVYLGICTLVAYLIGVIFLAPGIPLLVSGLKNLTRGNRERRIANLNIRMLKENGYIENPNANIFNAMHNAPYTAQQPVAPQYGAERTMFCSQCGGKIPADSAFCSHCGAKVNK